ncbi:hypothetical protein ACN47E_001878 [Coniothyrium glycines]
MCEQAISAQPASADTPCPGSQQSSSKPPGTGKAIELSSDSSCFKDGGPSTTRLAAYQQLLFSLSHSKTDSLGVSNLKIDDEITNALHKCKDWLESGMARRDGTQIFKKLRVLPDEPSSEELEEIAEHLLELEARQCVHDFGRDLVAACSLPAGVLPSDSAATTTTKEAVKSPSLPTASVEHIPNSPPRISSQTSIDVVDDFISSKASLGLDLTISESLENDKPSARASEDVATQTVARCDAYSGPPHADQANALTAIERMKELVRAYGKDLAMDIIMPCSGVVAATESSTSFLSWVKEILGKSQFELVEADVRKLYACVDALQTDIYVRGRRRVLLTLAMQLAVAFSRFQIHTSLDPANSKLEESEEETSVNSMNINALQKSLQIADEEFRKFRHKAMLQEDDSSSEIHSLKQDLVLKDNQVKDYTNKLMLLRKHSTEKISRLEDQLANQHSMITSQLRNEHKEKLKEKLTAFARDKDTEINALKQSFKSKIAAADQKFLQHNKDVAKIEDLEQEVATLKAMQKTSNIAHVTVSKENKELKLQLSNMGDFKNAYDQIVLENEEIRSENCDLKAERDELKAKVEHVQLPAQKNAHAADEAPCSRTTDCSTTEPQIARSQEQNLQRLEMEWTNKFKLKSASVDEKKVEIARHDKEIAVLNAKLIELRKQKDGKNSVNDCMDERRADL